MTPFSSDTYVLPAPAQVSFHHFTIDGVLIRAPELFLHISVFWMFFFGCGYFLEFSGVFGHLGPKMLELAQMPENIRKTTNFPKYLKIGDSDKGVLICKSLI